MSILIDKSTRLLVQGITGRDGLFHAKKMAEYGTNVVGGTSPGKGGTMVDDTFPVFNTMYEAVRRTQANTSIIFVPARFAADAIMEAADAGIRLIICITEGIPTLDVIKAYRFAEQKGAKLIGPNCPGLISPGKSLVGILPGPGIQSGQYRSDKPKRNTDLRNRVTSHSRRYGAIHRYRHGRRSCCRTLFP